MLSRVGRNTLSSSSSISSRPWPNSIKGVSLPGGFNKDGLREWAMLTDFGANGHENLTSHEMRRRRRQLSDDPKKLPYVDLFSKRLSDECSEYLSCHPSPSNLLGQAYFGSKGFVGEKMLLSSFNSLFSIYPSIAADLPRKFEVGEQYLQWKVAEKSPLELICSYSVERLQLRGCTMLAFDPSLRRAYHGNCIDVEQERIKGYLPEIGLKIHAKYTTFLLESMVNELENIAMEKG